MSPTDAAAIERANRRKQAVELRAQGHTLRQIAEQLGVAVSTVHADIERAIKEIPNEEVTTLRAIWGDRLEAAVKIVMPQIREGDLKAIDKLIALANRASRLHGLDQPTQVEVAGVDVDLDRAMGDLKAALNGSTFDERNDNDV